MQRRIARVGVSLIATVVLLVAAGISAAPSGAVGTFDPHLTRAPYLTDLVGLHVIVNWATDTSTTTGSVKWGNVTGGSCAITNTQSATRSSLTVGSVSEYRWNASLTLPSSGTYCYRAFLGTTDLLAGNPSSQFVTQSTPGSGETFSFGVFGDWGEVDSSGNNPDQANLMSQIAGAGLRFAVTTGDNGYPSGSQTNYGDLQQVGADKSAIFGPAFWTQAGGSTPLFTSVGNHGLSGTTHADITNWPQDVAVSSSGGRYQNDVYCCVNGTTSSNYASEWYAFDAGSARVYMLQAAWGDTNKGTADVYANDTAAHWSPGAPEYQWLLNDLQTHPSGVKFAVFHYPLYSDSKSQPSDVPLQNSLEPILKQYGVDIAFGGHAHIYQRNTASSVGAPVSYVTGGGGAKVAPIDQCSAIDAYGIGWSNSKSKGYKCGAAPLPTSRAQIFHFLKVTVSGTSVTVAPTDSLGRTFDVQTYDFGGAAPDTVLDSSPASLTASTSASFTFHATTTPATFMCSLDGSAATTCTSPADYTGLAAGNHTFSVAATTNGGTDPTAATRTWTIDTTAPSIPGGVTATATTSTSVQVAWNASTDATGVTGYDIFRNGIAVGSAAASSLTFADGGASAGTTYLYTVKARDGAGNTSAASGSVSVTTPAGTPPVFSDGFESGNFSAWTSSVGLVTQGSTVHGGSFAAEGNTTVGATYAKKTLPSTYSDGYGRVSFNLLSASSQVNLLRMRTAADGSLGYVFVTASGQVGLRNDVGATTTMSSAVAAPGSGWHTIELHLVVNGTSSSVEVWLDGTKLADVSPSNVNLGTTAIGRLQIGEVQSGRTYDVVLDDAAFGTQRIGV